MSYVLIIVFWSAGVPALAYRSYDTLEQCEEFKSTWLIKNTIHIGCYPIKKGDPS